ncbi:hypothetical protein GDO86_010310 [Hymenochirus boettgeri]|uniref:Uncharacterized protein n=1 Tax=Hymenochirus boettgeri TaxID=247094 RepID=A0A8T2JQ28_9PIPI|nr:hypothetical protein GDO86_010310 [Hymenochirus boettgeri]
MLQGACDLRYIEDIRDCHLIAHLTEEATCLPGSKLILSSRRPSYYDESIYGSLYYLNIKLRFQAPKNKQKKHYYDTLPLK